MRSILTSLALIATLLIPAPSLAQTPFAPCDAEVQRDGQNRVVSATVYRHGERVGALQRAGSWYVWRVQCAAFPPHRTFPSIQKAYWAACAYCPTQ